MKYHEKTNSWEGTITEHLQKLLDTHTCMCSRVRIVLKGLIEGKDVIFEEENKK